MMESLDLKEQGGQVDSVFLEIIYETQIQVVHLSNIFATTIDQVHFSLIFTLKTDSVSPIQGSTLLSYKNKLFLCIQLKQQSIWIVSVGDHLAILDLTEFVTLPLKLTSSCFHSSSIISFDSESIYIICSSTIQIISLNSMNWSLTLQTLMLSTARLIGVKHLIKDIYLVLFEDSALVAYFLDNITAPIKYFDSILDPSIILADATQEIDSSIKLKIVLNSQKGVIFEDINMKDMPANNESRDVSLYFANQIELERVT